VRPPPTPRLPIGPVLTALGRIEDLNHGAGLHDRCRSYGLRARSINRYVTEGGVPLTSADHVAISLGYHPAQLWGRAYLDAAIDHGRQLDAHHERQRERTRARKAAYRTRQRAAA
jgi:hypothetical protein